MNSHLYLQHVLTTEEAGDQVIFVLMMSYDGEDMGGGGRTCGIAVLVKDEHGWTLWLHPERRTQVQWL